MIDVLLKKSSKTYIDQSPNHTPTFILYTFNSRNDGESNINIFIY